MQKLVDGTLSGHGDCSSWRVHNLLTGNEMYFESWLSMSVRGLLSTYAIPSISSVLHSTGGFDKDVQRRYADMELLIREFSENAVDGTEDWNGQPERAKLAIHRLNAIHNAYGKSILLQDMRYVLSVFMLTPAIWCESHWARRAMTLREKECVYQHWMNIGKMMKIELLPQQEWESFESVLNFKRRYEEKYARFKSTNKAVAFSTFEYFLQQFPVFLQELSRPVVWHSISAMQETKAQAKAVGLPWPPHPLIWFAVDVSLTFNAFFCRYLLPPWPLSWTERLTGKSPTIQAGCPFHVYLPQRPLDFGNQTYNTTMKGYAIEQMGPRCIPPGLLEENPKYSNAQSTEETTI